MKYSDVERIKKEYDSVILIFEEMLSLYAKHDLDKTIKGNILLNTLKKSVEKHEEDFKTQEIDITELYENIKSVKNLLIWVMKKDTGRPDTNIKNLNEGKMKKSELRQIIKEEIQTVITENSIVDFINLAFSKLQNVLKLKTKPDVNNMMAILEKDPKWTAALKKLQQEKPQLAEGIIDVLKQKFKRRANILNMALEFKKNLEHEATKGTINEATITREHIGNAIAALGLGSLITSIATIGVVAVAGKADLLGPGGLAFALAIILFTIGQKVGISIG